MSLLNYFAGLIYVTETEHNKVMRMYKWDIMLDILHTASQSPAQNRHSDSLLLKPFSSA